MDVGGDEVAGVVDIFGTLSREELHAALEELAFRYDQDPTSEELTALVDEAVERFYLVPVGDRLVAGPAAFPTLPEAAEDLPHILDVDRRSVDRAAAAEAAEERFRAVTATAVEEGGEERLAELLDVSYDLEAWGPVELGDARDAIDRTLEGYGSGDGRGG